MENSPNDSNTEITPQFVIEFIPKLLLSNNNERSLAEKQLEQYYYEPKFYQNLIEIGLYNTTINNDLKLHMFIILRKLLKEYIFINNKTATPFKLRKSFEEESNIKRETIINNLKIHLMSYLNKGDFSQNYNKIIKEIVCLISKNYFPFKWKELFNYYTEFFEYNYNNSFSTKYFDIAMFISNMFYTTMKNFDNKNRIDANFDIFKTKYTNSFMNYYNNMKDLFVYHPEGVINETVTEKCFKLMYKNDKILILLIKFNFNINQLHKNNVFIQLINILLIRIKSLLQMFEAIKIKNYKNILEKNIFKIFEHTVLIIQKDPIIFCYHIDQLLDILCPMLKHCELFQEDTTKVILFTLSKIMSTNIYKDNAENLELNSQKKFDSLSIITPTKPKNNIQNNNIITPLRSMVSPSKYKNFDKELLKANELYNKSMTEQNVTELLSCLINKIPYVYNNEIDDPEIEILSHFQEDKSSSRDIFSTDTMTFDSLKQYFLEQLIINFTEWIMKFVDNNLKILYSLDKKQMDFYMIYSFFNVVNSIASLYQKKIISITELIDTHKYLSFIEKFAPENQLMLRSYIIALSKWSILLISNENIINYINNLNNLLSNTTNTYVLLESCLCLQNIIKNIDHLMDRQENINTFTNKTNLIKTIKTKINWGDLFCKVTEIMNCILPEIKTSELLVALIEFFTSLIEKCHLQNDGNIINTIKNSKLIEMMSNLKDEFTEGVYRDMFQKLILNFPSSNEILEMSLFFVENRIRQKPSFENINLLLYLISKSDNNDENKKLIIEFTKRNHNLFTTKFNYNISTVITQILTEILLYQVLPENEMQKILEIIINNYKESNIKFNYYYDYIINNVNIQGENFNEINKKIEEFSDYKSALLESIKISLLIYANILHKDISSNLNNILEIIFIELQKCIILNKKNPLLSSSKLKNFTPNFQFLLIEVVTRICLYNTENFKKNLNIFLTSQKINIGNFLINLFERMFETMSFIQRGINVLFISTVITWFDFNFLNQNRALIFDLVINRINEKKTLTENDLFINKNKYVDSLRKQKLIHDELLLKTFDIKKQFTQSIDIICKNANVNTNEWISSFDTKNKIKNVFGFK